ncbi:pyridoxal phosphate-dependent aminotransferase [Clostridium sporogenes]|uniref:cysteine-S-conjugate beta-lyase n=2 Tax=Clostridium TaxID=1485 RepID=A0A0D1BSX4_CLOBO|nr:MULTISPECIES: MalY/PatB family protein [Clostridium]MBE6076416.1 pyridoxal phosphate-dependent aminotransferase [Clostridium lundense]MDU2833291.1 MalY/PatB family protein [Clostridium botulinum]EDU37374.1 aminotransferase, class I/II [Clostridium sporogenes ATCC 15579]KIS23415.1 cystathionine beta-lyase [Clostridium botulinum B2 450]MCW6095390.1 pyridoxal phosphate-dependent aminotransferase [Clostridium sporogenes]
MKYNFDKVVNRDNTNCSKWNFNKETFGYEDIISMWIADMDFETLPEVKEEIINRAYHGIYGYTATTESYYEEVVNWMKKRHGWNIKKEWITNTPGIVMAVNTIVRAFTHSGDKVLLQRPIYYPFFKAINNNGCHIVNNPLKFNGKRYEMDFEDLDNKLSDPRVKIMILCSPHNPTGRVWTKEELVKVGNLCLKHNVLVISDEIHSDLIYKPNRHIPFAAICKEFADISITCTAPSKTFNLAGLQGSNIIISNERLMNEFKIAMENIGLSRLNIFASIACEAAYKYGEQWVEELVDYLQENKEFAKKFIEEKMPMLKVIEPEGTYLLWIDCRELKMSKEELEEFMLKEAGVAFDEGYIFGEEAIGFERMNIACPREVLNEALERIEKAINNKI